MESKLKKRHNKQVKTNTQNCGDSTVMALLMSLDLDPLTQRQWLHQARLQIAVLELTFPSRPLEDVICFGRQGGTITRLSVWQRDSSRSLPHPEWLVALRQAPRMLSTLEFGSLRVTHKRSPDNVHNYTRRKCTARTAMSKTGSLSCQLSTALCVVYSVLQLCGKI